MKETWKTLLGNSQMPADVDPSHLHSRSCQIVPYTYMWLNNHLFRRQAFFHNNVIYYKIILYDLFVSKNYTPLNLKETKC